MAAPTPSNVRLPDDSGNLGKRVRTQIRDVGGTSVHEHFYVPISARNKTGIYVASYANLTIQAGAHTSLQGYAWLINPVGSAVKVAVRRIEVSSMAIAAAAVNNYLAVERVTFTGTPSGAQITPLKVETSMASNVATLRTASTGLSLATVGGNAAAYAYWITAIITAAGAVVPVLQEWEPDEEGMIVLAAGEGIVFRQPVTGDVDQRVNINIAWEEFE